jgi:hypothetical protein
MRWIVCCAVLALATFGCDDGDSDDGGSGTGGSQSGGAGGESGGGDAHGAAEEEACEHMADGPFAEVAAAADAMGAGSVAVEHTRVNVDLSGGNTVLFPVDEAGDYIFFLSDDVAVTVSQAGATVAFEESGPVDACADVAVHYVLELEVGPATIEFGETDLTTVGFVFEHAGEGHDHEGEDHDHEGEQHHEGEEHEGEEHGDEHMEG